MATAAAFLGLAAVDARSCGEGLGADTSRIGDARLQLVFRASPQPIVVGRHFSLDFVLCPVGPAPPPKEVRVDAHMPAHRHGMNYRASVRSRGAGVYRAEGLMFHMPGHWELVFEFSGNDGSMRLVQSLLVE